MGKEHGPNFLGAMSATPWDLSGGNPGFGTVGGSRDLFLWSEHGVAEYSILICLQSSLDRSDLLPWEGGGKVI